MTVTAAAINVMSKAETVKLAKATPLPNPLGSYRTAYDLAGPSGTRHDHMNNIIYTLNIPCLNCTTSTGLDCPDYCPTISAPVADLTPAQRSAEHHRLCCIPTPTAAEQQRQHAIEVSLYDALPTAAKQGRHAVADPTGAR